VALSGGNFKNLAEALKLTEPYLIPGIVEEDKKVGNPALILPVAFANETGTEIRWNREVDSNSDAVADIAQGGQTTLKEDVEYDQQTAKLKTCYDYRALNKYNQRIFGNYNNYEEITVNGMFKRVLYRLGDKIIYDDITYGGSEQMDGIHAWAAVQTGTDLDIDNGEAGLSLANWRKLLYAMKYGVDYWLVARPICKHIDASLQEKGFAGLATATAGALGMFAQTKNDFGVPVTSFGGAPIVMTDFLKDEQANTGVGSDARAAYTSGTKNYSIIGVRAGQASLAEEDPGLKVAFGLTEDSAEEEIFNLEYFEKHPDYIAKAYRLSVNTENIPGSKYCIGRIYDITDAAITV